MVCHMKTTLNIHPTVMTKLKQEAARRGCTMSELVESALRTMLERKKPAADLPPLPQFHCGGALVDVSNREALYTAMEQR